MAYLYSVRYAGVPANCQTCGATVSKEFVRVFGSNDGEAHARPGCATWDDIKGGAGTGPNADGEPKVSVRPTVSGELAQAGETEAAQTNDEALVNWTQTPSNSKTPDQRRSESNGPAFADLLG
jgi:hypothetical protein